MHYSSGLTFLSTGHSHHGLENQEPAAIDGKRS